MNSELLYKDWTHLLDYDIEDSYAKSCEEITTVLKQTCTSSTETNTIKRYL